MQQPTTDSGLPQELGDNAYILERLPQGLRDQLRIPLATRTDARALMSELVFGAKLNTHECAMLITSFDTGAGAPFADHSDPYFVAMIAVDDVLENTPEPQQRAIRARYERAAEVGLSRRFRPVLALSLQATSAHRIDLVAGLLHRGDLSTLVGQSGIGKSAVAMSASIAIALGVPWLGLLTTKGRALYVCAEGQGTIVPRLRAFCAHHGLADATQVVEVMPEQLSLTSPREASEFIGDIAAHLSGSRYDFIVVDTLNMFFGDGDENSATDMGRFVRACRELMAVAGNPHLMIVHHSGKKEGGLRGSSALRAAIDVGLALEQDGRDRIKLTNEKPSRYEGPVPSEPIYLRLVSGTVPQAPGYAGPNTAVVVERGEAAIKPGLTPKQAPKRGDAADAILRLLASGPRRNTELQHAAGFNKQTFLRALKALRKQGDIDVREDGRYHINSLLPDGTGN